MQRHPLFRPYAALIAVCFFWGTTYLGIRMSLETFPPLALVSIRYILSGGILLAIAVARGAQLPRGKEFGAACVAGFFTLFLGNSALVFAELTVPSGMAGLIITISPFWMVGMEALLPGGEGLHAPTIGAMLVGLAGAALLVTQDVGTHAVSQTLLHGFLLLQFSMAAWSFGSIYMRRNSGKAHPVTAGAVQQLAAGVMLAPFALLIHEHRFLWSARGVSALFYLVIFGSIVGYSSYAYALDRLPVAIVSIYPYANSIVAVTLGWLFYREPFGPRQAVAMAVIFAGVALVKRFARRAD